MEPRNFGMVMLARPDPSGAHMDAHGNIQFFGQSEVGVHRGIAGREALILQSNFAHHFESVAW